MTPVPTDVVRTLFEILDGEVVGAFEYVEPTSDNLRTYSVRFYRLHKDICGGIDSLLHAWYERRAGIESKTTLRDYWLLLSDTTLDFQTQRFLRVRRNPALELAPFSGWTETTPPSWWTDHTMTKHQLRESTLPLGNLSNVLNSLGAFYVLLHDRETRGTYPIAPQVFTPIW